MLIMTTTVWWSSAASPSSIARPVPQVQRAEYFHLTSVGYRHRCRWNRRLELRRSVGLNPSLGRRVEILVCGGGLEELAGGRADEAVIQDGEYGSSSLGSAVKNGEEPTSRSSDEMISKPSTVSSVQASEFSWVTSSFGVLITGGYFVLSAGGIALVDYYIMKALPRSAIPCPLMAPFILSAGVTAILGYFFVPVLKYFKAAQIFRIEGPTAHLVKTGTPTMGGIFFVPVGVAIARLFTGFHSRELQGALLCTLAFAAIGLMDDGLAFWRKHNYGVPGWVKFVLQVAVGMSLFFWLEFAKLSYPHKMNDIVWFPFPFGPVHFGKWYLPLTAFCCAAMSNGVNLTDGLDGLAGGTAAVVFIAMSVAVLPAFPALGVFGSSMSGACFGFLVHNRYKANVFMGDTGSLALGGALAAMACCSGMFFPLFIASGVFVIETVSVIVQVYNEFQRSTFIMVLASSGYIEFAGLCFTRV